MTTDAGETALRKAEWQPILFAERPSRFELLKLVPAWARRALRVRVHRNHSFEHVVGPMAPFLALADLEAMISYSHYDDSLSFSTVAHEQADLEILWIDFSRYQKDFGGRELADWFGQRLSALRRESGAPIILMALSIEASVRQDLRSVSATLAGVHMADMESLAAELGEAFYDDRAARFSGTRLSDAGCLLVARRLACQWIPATVMAPLKAVVVDADDTLYEGVLGEDGDRVRLTPGHEALQRYLLSLRERGIFLAVVSRNDETDLRLLFQNRTDFPLRWQDFSASAVGWGGKADGLRKVAETLRVGTESLLFVDDNPGELASVASRLGGIATVHAMKDPMVSRRVLEHFPGLWAWLETTTDRVRIADLEAASVRMALAAQSPHSLDYLGSLRVKLSITVTPREHLSRLHQLSQKTNQFNLNLQRFSEAELGNLLGKDDHRIAIVGLSDRLADSGLVGMVVARRVGDGLEICELAISCRALGRGVEDLMVAECVRAIQAELPSAEVRFLHRTGPRNGPAREWLARMTRTTLPPEGSVSAGEALQRIQSADFPVSVEIVPDGTPRN